MPAISEVLSRRQALLNQQQQAKGFLGQRDQLEISPAQSLHPKERKAKGNCCPHCLRSLLLLFLAVNFCQQRPSHSDANSSQSSLSLPCAWPVAGTAAAGSLPCSRCASQPLLPGACARAGPGLPEEIAARCRDRVQLQQSRPWGPGCEQPSS